MNYHDITKDDMNNGDGLRVVLWVAGCNHHCECCQNPITWDKNGGIKFDDAAKKEIFEELSKEYISGITLTGGDPLFPDNRREIKSLILEIREHFPQKTIWLYTGYKWEDVVKELDIYEIVKLCDIIVDGPFEIKKRDISCHWKGSTNQRVIDIKETLEKNTIMIKEEESTTQTYG